MCHVSITAGSHAAPPSHPDMGEPSQPRSVSATLTRAKQVVGTRSAVAMLSPKISESRVCHGSAQEGCGPGYDGSRIGSAVGRSARRQTRCRQSGRIAASIRASFA